MRFQLVDRILELDSGQRARGLKNVARSEDFFEHHFPASAIMPGALITEALVQLTEWVVREATDFRCIPLVTHCQQARFHRLVRPGDQLELEVIVLDMDESGLRFKGVARSQGKRVASGRFAMALHAAEDFEDPADARDLFAELMASTTEEQDRREAVS